MFNESKMRIYVCIKYSWLSVRLVQDGSAPRIYENDTNILVQPTSRGEINVISVGNQVSNLLTGVPVNARLANAFDHPRTVIKDFTLAVSTLKFFVEQAYGKKLLFRVGVMIIHPQDRVEGGLSDVETRALTDMALSSCAKDACVYTQPMELTDQQLLKIKRKNDPASLSPQIQWR